MSQIRDSAIYAQRLILEYNRARKLLRKYFKARRDPDEVRLKIKEILENTTRRQSKIIGYTLNDAFKAGTKEGSREINNATISASSATVGFDLSKVTDMHLNRISSKTIGSIGKYNSLLTNQLQLEYNALLADNRLVTSLNKHGWTPWLDKALERRGVSPEVIALAKGQTTTKKIVSILEHEGIRGGRNPREVSKLLLPHIQRHFGPEGVVINNVGKIKRVLKVDADGNYKYVKQAITKPYRATPKAYSNLLARSSMIQAHHEGRYQSLQKTGLVDHYISVSLLDANTCNLCATMHGQRVSHSEGPLYHPSGACELKPIWKKDSGLKNKDPAFYENQRDQHFWKQYQLAEYNKGMPRGAKLKFHSMLPKDALTAMPDKAAMRAIRYNTLGKPTEIKEKVKVQKIVKEKAVKKDPLEELKKKERETADELWEKTNKDGNEHAKVSNSKTFYGDGDKHGVGCQKPNAPFKSHHTHPNWDSPFSGDDIANFLTNSNFTQQSASSPKRIYLASRRGDTITKLDKDRVGLIEKFKKMASKANVEGTKEYKRKTGWSPATKGQRQKIWHDALEEAAEKFAKEYNFDYITFKRK